MGTALLSAEMAELLNEILLLTMSLDVSIIFSSLSGCFLGLIVLSDNCCRDSKLMTFDSSLGSIDSV